MKRWVSVLLALVIMFSLVGCGVEIEDTNGADDYSLETITDRNIIKKDVGSSGASYSDRGGAGFVSRKCSSKNFSGVEEIWGETFLTGSGLWVEMNGLRVKKGNFKVCVLMEDEIVHEFSLDEDFQTFELNDVKGYVSVVIAGESAAYEFFLNVY